MGTNRRPYLGDFLDVSDRLEPQLDFVQGWCWCTAIDTLWQGSSSRKAGAVDGHRRAGGRGEGC